MKTPPALPRAFAAAVLGCLLAPAISLAADGEKTPLQLDGSGKEAAETVSTGGGGMVRTIVGLAVVIGVIYGLTWVLTQLTSSKQECAEGAGLESLATLPLGTNRSLHLVRAGDEIVLVGAGEHGVTPIRSYTAAEARALGLVDGDAGSAMQALEPEVFGKETKRGRLVDELRRRTVIK